MSSKNNIQQTRFSFNQMIIYKISYKVTVFWNFETLYKQKTLTFRHTPLKLRILSSLCMFVNHAHKFFSYYENMRVWKTGNKTSVLQISIYELQKPFSTFLGGSKLAKNMFISYLRSNVRGRNYCFLCMPYQLGFPFIPSHYSPFLFKHLFQSFEM